MVIINFSDKAPAPELSPVPGSGILGFPGLEGSQDADGFLIYNKTVDSVSREVNGNRYFNNCQQQPGDRSGSEEGLQQGRGSGP